MAFTYSFVDNEIYGTDDINDITKSLTGAGVAPFVSKDSYNVSDLNNVTSALVGEGVQLDGCLCSVVDAGTSERHIEIAQGIVFFESGVRMTVDEEGYILPIEPNTDGYIYAQYSPSLQKADIVFSRELPTDGECVPLVKVLADGTLLDKRTFARSKIATLGENATYRISEDRITVYNELYLAPYYSDAEKILAEIDLSGIDITKFNYLIYQYDGWEAIGLEKYYDLKNNSRARFYIKNTLYYSEPIFDIVPEGTKFVIVTEAGDAVKYNMHHTAFNSSIPYLRLV